MTCYTYIIIYYYKACFQINDIFIILIVFIFYFHDNFAKHIHESLQCIFYSDNVYFIQRFSVVFIPPYLAEILSTLKNGIHAGGLKNQI